MSNWIECTLKDIITFKNGKKKPNIQGIYPVYGGNGILAYANDYNLSKGIAVGRVGVYCGSVFYSDSECWISDNAIQAVNTGLSDLKFDYYLLKSLNLNEYRIGTSQPLLTQEILNRIVVKCPDIIAQKKIASILTSIDDKILQNNKVNCNLEQQARAIYQNMIIDNQSDEWEIGKLSDIAEITMGQSPKGDTYNENGIGTVFYQGRAEFGSRFPTRRLFTTEPKRMANEYDVLLSVRAPVGDLNIATEPCCIGRGLGAIHSIDNHQSFVLYTMLAVRKQLDIFNGEGTVFGSINKEALNAISVIIPDKPTLDRFETIVAPIDSAIRTNYEEICRLQNIRDTILPKLMNGKIDVSEVEI